MAAGPITQISDIVVPEVFTAYVRQETEEKTRIIDAGVAHVRRFSTRSSLPEV
jgi:hypothetical protein